MKWLASITFFLFVHLANGQGCSDAGFCTIPAFKPLGEQDSTKFTLEFRGSLEGSEPGALIFSPQLWFSYKASDAIQLSVKVPYWLLNDDSLGSVSSFNDPIVSASFRVYNKNNIVVNVTGGFRFGIGNASLTGNENVSLPMDYQPTLGTTDIIIGGNFRKDDFSASIALQFPIWQYNENLNVVERYLTNEDVDPGTLRYFRRADIMLRLDKRWVFNNWGVQVGLLPIYHLGNDELRSTANTGYVEIEGSEGFTVNIPVGAWYKSNHWLFGLEAGVPIVVRDERPDGLTRRYVIQPRIVYSF
jgi:hypothetical protein